MHLLLCGIQTIRSCPFARWTGWPARHAHTREAKIFVRVKLMSWQSGLTENMLELRTGGKLVFSCRWEKNNVPQRREGTVTLDVLRQQSRALPVWPLWMKQESMWRKMYTVCIQIGWAHSRSYDSSPEDYTNWLDFRTKALQETYRADACVPFSVTHGDTSHSAHCIQCHLYSTESPCVWWIKSSPSTLRK